MYDIESMRRFAQLELLDDAILDETTILKFRHMIERHTLSEAIFADINNYLVEKGIQVSQGSMVDATMIQAASSNRTLLQSDQMSIWLPKGPIQRTKKESGTSIHFIGIGQFVHAQRKISGITPPSSRKKAR